MKFGKNQRLKTDMDGRSRLSLNDSDEEEIDYHIFPGTRYKTCLVLTTTTLVEDVGKFWYCKDFAVPTVIGYNFKAAQIVKLTIVGHKKGFASLCHTNGLTMYILCHKRH